MTKYMYFWPSYRTMIFAGHISLAEIYYNQLLQCWVHVINNQGPGSLASHGVTNSNISIKWYNFIQKMIFISIKFMKETGSHNIFEKKRTWAKIIKLKAYWYWVKLTSDTKLTNQMLAVWDWSSFVSFIILESAIVSFI